MSVKICRECGKEFEPTDIRQQICSDNCRKIRNRRASLEWTVAHPEIMRARQKAMRRIASKNCIVICKICGAPVDPYENWNGRICRRRIHESCIFKDVAETALKGGRLSELQKSRLRNLGAAVDDALEEYKNHEI